MCNPAAAVMTILTVITTAVQINQANDAADAQADAINAKVTTNLAALDDKSEEITDKASLARFEKRKQVQREVATTRAAQSEGGVLFGNTALRTLAATMMGGSQDLALIDKQHTTLQKQVGRRKESVAAGGDLQLAGLSWTSPLMAGLQATTAGGATYAGAGGKFS